MKILVIDDNTAILDVTGSLLRHFGHVVETASGGRVGIQKFENDTFDMVITDIVMPDVDGENIARHIRSRQRSLPRIIAMSATPWKVNRNYFDALLSKPFSIQDLLDCVEGR